MPWRPSHSSWLRSFLRYVLWLVPAWALATFVCGRLVFGTDTPVPLQEEWARAAALGLVAGTLGAFVEARLLPRFARRLPFGVTLLLRTVAYATLITALLVLGVVGFVWDRDPSATLSEAMTGRDVRALVSSGQLAWIFGLLLGASFLIMLAFQVNRVLGPGTLGALLLGRYLRPVSEERVFMFLDLTDSTPIAERLGAFRFTDFKNDFFHDVAGPVLATRGQIFQYVGDEVVISWSLRTATRNANCLRLFMLVEKAVEARRTWYESRYGVVPQVKAACHGGPVVTAEVGDLKCDIVHSGDTLNTTARMEGLCRPLNQRLLVSESLLNRLSLPAELRAEEVGVVPLRGKTEATRLFGIERTDRPRETPTLRADVAPGISDPLQV